MRKLREEKGGLTVEASIVLPLFLIFVLLFVYLIHTYYVYGNINMSMYSACKRISVKAYETNYSEDTSKEYSSNLDNNINNNFQNIDRDECRKSIYDSLTKDVLEKTYIKGGLEGIDTSGSNYNTDNDIVNLSCKYAFNVPFNNIGIINNNIVQHMSMRGWTGDKSLISNKNFVYITRTGTVYHTDIQCTYLMVKKTAILRNEIGNYRNEGGAKYYQCKECDDEANGKYVYITKYGTSYHNLAICSSINRNIIPIDIHEVKGRKKCAKCCN